MAFLTINGIPITIQGENIKMTVPTVESEIVRLNDAKSKIKASIERKGVSVNPDAVLNTYPEYIDKIQSGGGGGSITYKTWHEIALEVYESNKDLTSEANIVCLVKYDDYGRNQPSDGFMYSLSKRVYNDGYTTSYAEQYMPSKYLQNAIGEKYYWYIDSVSKAEVSEFTPDGQLYIVFRSKDETFSKLNDAVYESTCLGMDLGGFLVAANFNFRSNSIVDLHGIPTMTDLDIRNTAPNLENISMYKTAELKASSSFDGVSISPRCISKVSIDNLISKLSTTNAGYFGFGVLTAEQQSAIEAKGWSY